MERCDTKKFIEKAKIVHGNKYDYSKVKYISASNKVCIICNEHGEFYQTPDKHLRGHGCPLCGKEHRCTTDKFIEKAKKTHGDRYDYSKVEYVNNKTDVCIICKEHGEFLQKPVHHINGHGCPVCGGSLKGNTDSFIERAIAIHGNRYDYSKVNYVNVTTPVSIICKVHGEFKQSPASHLHGSGCPSCGGNVRYDFNTFLEKAKSIHGDRYDYSKVDFVNTKTKVCIICPKHGEFWQNPEKHFAGQGCPRCIGHNLTESQLIEEFRHVHGDKYDYSKVVYKKKKEKVCIICQTHGEFLQSPSCHLAGEGCPKCGTEKNALDRIMTRDEFIKKSKAIYGEKYDYNKVEYINAKTPVSIICPSHGEFKITPNIHIYSKCGCPMCSFSSSIAEEEITNYIKSIYGGIVLNRKKGIIPSLELDIYIPGKKVAIEYNGLIWHSEMYNKDKSYHLRKLNLCKEKGIKLIHIFEDEYLNHKDIVLSKIKHLLCESNNEKIYARKCTVVEISYDAASEFLDKNHIQGKVASTIYIGSFYNERLIGVMTMRRLNNNNNSWELTRLATDNNYICIGVGGKMFSYFVKKYNPEYVKSFADRRWTINEDENLYTKIGFEKEYYTAPDYRYYSSKTGCNRIHKFNMRRINLIKKYGANPNDSESVMTVKLGFYKVWDCGLIKYVWKKYQ